LVEVAIALAIISIIISAVWTAGGAVRNRYRVESSVEAITEIADRTRALYRAYPGTSNYASSTSKQISANLFPDNVVKSDSATTNEWGGEVRIAFKRVNDWIVGFSVAMDISSTIPVEVRNQACMDMVQRLQGSGHSGAGVSTTNDVPLPSTYPLAAEDISPDEGPVFVYAGSSGWTNVTHKSPIELLSTFGSNGCKNVAFYFRL